MFCLDLLIFSTVLLAGDSKTATPLPQTGSHYELRLSGLEFAILHEAAARGVTRYGGDASFSIRIEGSGESLTWIVSFEESRLLEVWSHWTAELIADAFNDIDFESLRPTDHRHLSALRSIYSGLKSATPIWEAQSFTGRVREGEDGSLRIFTETGEALLEIEDSAVQVGLGEAVILGHVERPGHLRVAKAWPRQRDVLEVFVMSHCPFGEVAQREIVQALGSPGTGPRPRVEFRYLFQPPGNDGGPWSAMHGGPELTENLVQMAIRDLHPDRFIGYLRSRLAFGRTTYWEDVAEAAGMGNDEIAATAAMIASSGRAMIEAEYAYTSRTYFAITASPTLIWEGLQVASLADVPSMDAVRLSDATCGTGYPENL